MQTNTKCRQFRYPSELHRETKAWVSGAFTALPSVGRKVRYRHKVDGIWHSDNGECSYRNCLPKSILLGLIGLSRGAKSALQRLHWLFPHTFFIPIFHWYHHQSNTPTDNTCQNPRISPTWYVLLCAQWKFGLLMAFPSAERRTRLSGRGRGRNL